MSLQAVRPELQHLCSRLQEDIGPYLGRVEYGNLRSRISEWDCGSGEPITNVALVYETPGGSTDQINITYYHDSSTFVLVDAAEGELSTPSIDTVLETIRPRVSGIPGRRREALFDEIRRQIDAGSNTAGVVGHLNRMMQSGLRGGTITLPEMKDAMTFAVQYIKGRGAPASAN
jgi:hypothetical protein